MEFLRLLESIRSPFLDRVAAVITMLGEETVFMLVGMALLWCFDKKWGFRFFFIGLVGNTLNQLMKAIFLIPRPWVLDVSCARRKERMDTDRHHVRADARLVDGR